MTAATVLTTVEDTGYSDLVAAAMQSLAAAEPAEVAVPVLIDPEIAGAPVAWGIIPPNA